MLMTKLLKIIGKVVFKELQENLWLINFIDEGDKSMVMQGRPGFSIKILWCYKSSMTCQ
jgi:hypothetical protein